MVRTTNCIFFKSSLLACAIASSLILSTPVNATKLACKPGINEAVFAKTRISILRPDQEKFKQELEAWGEQNGYHVSSVGSEDPYTKPTTTTWTSFLQSEKYGIVLEIAGSNRNDTVQLSVGNNCWADQEDWKPHWRKLLTQISSWGYRTR